MKKTWEILRFACFSKSASNPWEIGNLGDYAGESCGYFSFGLADFWEVADYGLFEVCGSVLLKSVSNFGTFWNTMTYVTKTMVFEKVWNKKKLKPINVEKPMVPWAVWNTAKSERRIIFQLFVCGIRMAWAMGFPWLNLEEMFRETGCYHENVDFGVRFLFTWPNSSQPRPFWICFAEKLALRELTGIPVEQNPSFFRLMRILRILDGVLRCYKWINITIIIGQIWEFGRAQHLL